MKKIAANYPQENTFNIFSQVLQCTRATEKYLFCQNVCKLLVILRSEFDSDSAAGMIVSKFQWQKNFCPVYPKNHNPKEARVKMRIYMAGFFRESGLSGNVTEDQDGQRIFFLE